MFIVITGPKNPKNSELISQIPKIWIPKNLRSTFHALSESAIKFGCFTKRFFSTWPETLVVKNGDFFGQNCPQTPKYAFYDNKSNILLFLV